MANEVRPENRGKMSGYYVVMCIALLSPVGIVLWLMLDNPGLIGVGPAIGVAIGASLERRNADRYPTRGESGMKLTIFLAIGILVGGLLLALVLL